MTREEEREIRALGKIYFCLQDCAAHVITHSTWVEDALLYIRSAFDWEPQTKPFLIDDVTYRTIKAFATPQRYCTSDQMLLAFGLSFNRHYTHKAAREVVSKAMHVTNSPNLLNAAAIAWLEDETRRSLSRVPACTTSAAVVAGLLSSRSHDTYLQSVGIRLADELAEMDSPVYRDNLDIQCLKNESGEHAAFAAATLRNNQCTPEDRRIYEAGRLPNAQLIQRAKRAAARQFLIDLYNAQ